MAEEIKPQAVREEFYELEVSLRCGALSVYSKAEDYLINHDFEGLTDTGIKPGEIVKGAGIVSKWRRDLNVALLNTTREIGNRYPDGIDIVPRGEIDRLTAGTGAEVLGLQRQTDELTTRIDDISGENDRLTGENQRLYGQVRSVDGKYNERIRGLERVFDERVIELKSELSLVRDMYEGSTGAVERLNGDLEKNRYLMRMFFGHGEGNEDVVSNLLVNGKLYVIGGGRYGILFLRGLNKVKSAKAYMEGMGSIGEYLGSLAEGAITRIANVGKRRRTKPKSSVLKKLNSFLDRHEL